MKSVLAFAAVLAVASAAAQFGNFQQFGQPARYTGFPVTQAPRAQPPRPASVSVSRVSSSDQAANTLRFDNDVGPDGSYSYAVETDNGISVQAQGTPKDFGGNPPLTPVVSQGSYAYTSPEGQLITITYVADENGYQPSGDSLPTSPPIPDAILRSLEYTAKYVQKK